MLIRACCLLGLLVLIGGCSSFRDTLPARSATEQVLISTAADRAVERLKAPWMKGKSIFVDATNLDAYDKPYLMERVRSAVLDNGGLLAADREDAAIVLEVASGGLSVDTSQFLIGIPETALPIPFAQQSVTLPEVALFKLESRVGKAKLLFSAVDGASGARVAPLPVSYGRAARRFWWLFFVGPFEASDIPKEFR